jgi:hypothetical protein
LASTGIRASGTRGPRSGRFGTTASAARCGSGRRPGPDEPTLQALGERRFGDLHRLIPTAAEVAEQVQAELAASLAHLRRVDAAYWEREWRREHKASASTRKTTCGARPTATSTCTPATQTAGAT